MKDKAPSEQGQDLLKDIYHHVLTRSPSAEAAKIAIVTAWKEKKLELRADIREHKARPDLRLEPGQRPPKSKSRIARNSPLLPISTSDPRYIDHPIDWERSYKTYRNKETGSLFECTNIRARDWKHLWPARTATAYRQSMVRDVLRKKWPDGFPTVDKLPHPLFLKQARAALNADATTRNLPTERMRKTILRAVGREK